MAELRGMGWIGVLAVGLLAAPAASAGPVIGRTAEISIGREAASVVEQFYTVDTDPVAVARVRRIGRRLSSAAKDADFPFEFHVVEAGEVNAFALPGGFIYVFRGLLQLLPNDDALAFVLGHEVSHVTRRHAIRQFEKSLVLRAGLSAILLGTGTRGAWAAADAAQAIAGLAFTRSDESEADDVGIRLTADCGYDPRMGKDAMEVVRRANGDDRSTPAFLRSHPAPDSRIRKLAELAEELVAARPAPKETAPGPAAPRPEPGGIAGLEGFAPGASPWMPLATGARWVYRVRQEDTESPLVLRVLEAAPGPPAGVFRVEYDFIRGVKSVRLLAVNAVRFLSRTERGGSWREEASFPAEGAGAPALEAVEVPAGRFEALKVVRRGPDGQFEATLWFAKGVGLVRSVTAAGVVQELTSFNLPRGGEW